MDRSLGLSRTESTVVAAGLLAVAFPSAVAPVLGTVFTVVGLVLAVIGWILTHLTLCCTVAAVALLVRAFPGPVRRARWWLVMAASEAVDAIRPRAV